VRDMIYGGVEHHTWVYLRGEGDFSPDTAADAMTEMVYRGLACAAPATPATPAAPAEVTLRRLEAVAKQLEQTAGGAQARRGRRKL